MIKLTFLLLIPMIASRNIENGLGIYNGEDAADGEFPHIVSLRYRNHPLCGGSLISPYWVLTAAHCLFQCPEDYQVLYGSLDSFLNKTPPQEKIKNIIRYIIHDKFKLGFATHDIGLVQLAEPIALPNYMQLSNIPRAFDSPVTAAGWGLDSTLRPSTNLQKIDLTVYSDEKCKFYNKEQGIHYYSITQMCAGSPKGRTCRGDSGGPLVYNKVQYGIVSFGSKCTEDTPAYFTKVAPFRSWIRQHAEV